MYCRLLTGKILLIPFLAHYCSLSLSLTGPDGVPLYDALIRGKPPHPGARNFGKKNKVLGAAHSEDCVILSCTVLIGLKGVSDRQTDGQTEKQTDAQAIAKTCKALCC